MNITTGGPPANPMLAGRAIRCLAENWQHDVDNHTAGANKVTEAEAVAMQWAAVRAHCHPEAQDAVAFLLPQIREALAEIDDIGTGKLCDCPLGCRHEQALDAHVDELVERLVTGRIHAQRTLRAVGS